MGKLKDLTGQKFGRWTVVSRAPNGPKSHAFWNCRCECGTERSVCHSSLVAGTSKSCGCLTLEVLHKRATHGHTAGDKPTRAFTTWANIISRCTNHGASNYQYYGGSGITVCDRWRSFKDFLNDMGEPPEGLSIERINNSLGYSPENCRWATHTEQCNNRRNSRFISYNGITHTLSEWSRITGINRDTLKRRAKLKWPPEKMLFHPVINRTRSSNC